MLSDQVCCDVTMGLLFVYDQVNVLKVLHFSLRKLKAGIESASTRSGLRFTARLISPPKYHRLTIWYENKVLKRTIDRVVRFPSSAHW